MSMFKLSPLDFFFTCVGLLCLLADIVLDIFAVVSFYQEKEYVSLGLLLLFLGGSSVLVQIFSWLWYSYEDFRMETKIDAILGRTKLRVLHIFQLGIYVRLVVSLVCHNNCLGFSFCYTLACVNSDKDRFKIKSQ